MPNQPRRSAVLPATLGWLARTAGLAVPVFIAVLIGSAGALAQDPAEPVCSLGGGGRLQDHTPACQSILEWVVHVSASHGDTDRPERVQHADRSLVMREHLVEPLVALRRLVGAAAAQLHALRFQPRLP